MVKVRFPVSYRICLILLGIFSFTRIYRNSIDYFSQQTGGIWNIIMLLFLVIAFSELVFFKFSSKMPGEIKIAIAYACIAVLNAVLNIKEFSVLHCYNILMLFAFPASLISFYYAEKTNKIENGKDEKITIWLFLILGIMSFLSVFLFRIGKIEFSMISNVYYLLCLLPLFLLKTSNKCMRTFEYLFTLVCLMISGKRAGFLAFAAFVMIVSTTDIIQSKRVKKLLKFILVAVTGFIVFILFYEKFSEVLGIDIIDRIVNIGKDGGSGRSEMYLQVWEAMKKSCWSKWVFGYGYNATGEVLVVHDAVHNDFLESLYDFGVISCLLLVTFYIKLIRTSYKMYVNQYAYTGMFVGSIFISLFMSMFSIYFTTFTYMPCGMATVAVFLADWEKSRKKKLNENGR